MVFLEKKKTKCFGGHLVKNVNVTMPIYTLVKNFGCNDKEELLQPKTYGSALHPSGLPQERRREE